MSRIILIGCGKSKAPSPVSQAQNLYTGNLFAARRRYAEDSGCEWWIVSAEHGLLDPDHGPVRPYDTTMGDLSRLERAAWGLQVSADLLHALIGGDPDWEDVVSLRVELHMGLPYAEPLMRALRSADIEATHPVRGLQAGEQLCWYRARREEAA